VDGKAAETIQNLKCVGLEWS